MRRAPARRVGALLILALFPAPGSAQPSESCAAPPFRVFDFMIGGWHGEERSVADGDTVLASTSEVIVRSILEGCALEETWSVSTGEGPLFDARILRAYDPATQRWTLSYADTGGRVQMYEGRAEGGGWSFYRERWTDAGPILVRIRWMPTDDGFSQTIERSPDDGRSWEPGSVVRYRPADEASRNHTEDELFLFAFTIREGFDDGYRRHLEWHRAHADAFPWYGWTVASGDRIGLFVDGTAGICWRHSMPVSTRPGDAADFAVHVSPRATPAFRRVYRLRGDLESLPASGQLLVISASRSSGRVSIAMFPSPSRGHSSRGRSR